MAIPKEPERRAAGGVCKLSCPLPSILKPACQPPAIASKLSTYYVPATIPAHFIFITILILILQMRKLKFM